jgi:hypothetical protein
MHSLSSAFLRVQSEDREMNTLSRNPDHGSRSPSWCREICSFRSPAASTSRQRRTCSAGSCAQPRRLFLKAPRQLSLPVNGCLPQIRLQYPSDNRTATFRPQFGHTKPTSVVMILKKSIILRALFWWAGAESNCRHEDFQSSALPTELPAHRWARSRGEKAIRNIGSFNWYRTRPALASRWWRRSPRR